MLIIIGVGLALINKLSDSKTTPSDNAGSSKVAATAKTPATNACTLVTADEASKVISKPLQIDQSFTDAHAGKPQVSSIQAESVCPYVNKDNSLYGADIRAYTPGSYSKAVPMLKQSYDETKKAAQAVKGYQDISGLGDDAYWDAAGATLYVFKNDSYYRFGAQIPGAKESTLLAKDQVLANILLAKLPN